MLGKIVRIKCSTNIYRAILVIHPHGRETHPRVKETEFSLENLNSTICLRMHETQFLYLDFIRKNSVTLMAG